MSNDWVKWVSTKEDIGKLWIDFDRLRKQGDTRCAQYNRDKYKLSALVAILGKHYCVNWDLLGKALEHQSLQLQRQMQQMSTEGNYFPS